MRRIVFLLAVVAGLASPLWAANKAQTATVAQLGQWLTGAHGRSDGKITKELESMVLTERLSAAQLAQWQSAPLTAATAMPPLPWPMVPFFSRLRPPRCSPTRRLTPKPRRHCFARHRLRG
jgi:hypothetical protein